MRGTLRLLFIMGDNDKPPQVGFDARKPGFPTRSVTKRSAQSQKRARSLKIRIYTEEGSYYPSSENKGADQLCSNYTADLLFCFHLGKTPDVSNEYSVLHTRKKIIIKKKKK